MLEDYGIYPNKIQEAQKKYDKHLDKFINFLLSTSEDQNHFTLALIEKNGVNKFIEEISNILKNDKENVKKEYDKFKSKNTEIILSGAEAISLLLQDAEVKYIFGYPGTSELALCNSIQLTPRIELINGRGDKESAFMAAGGSLLIPAHSAAILHGARGLTNATGAIADAYRNEIGAIYLVGLPSTTSAPFFPPHGEKKLIESIGNFVKFYSELTELSSDTDSQREKNRKINEFIFKIEKTFFMAKSLPIGPVMIGLPQDIMEKRWIPYEALKNKKILKIKNKFPIKYMKSAENIINKKKNPVILIDDFLFKTPGSKNSLLNFSKKINAPILQIKYLRGPMLFERLSIKQNPYFAGSYDNKNLSHQKIMKNADLLITLEDRNGYPRVIGELPDCQKIAITSNPKMTKKNKYLKEKDLLLAGDVSEILISLTNNIIQKKSNSEKIINLCKKIYLENSPKIKVKNKYKFMRKDIVNIISEVFKKIENPIIIDDSQMFGGLIFEGYDKFPENIRVFGDHGGFIGGGMALSAGLSFVSKKNNKIFCFIGDQSFTNGLQSLVSVSQENIPVTFIICNNGKSVSLLKQAKSDNSEYFNHGFDRFLQNSPFIDYSKVSKEMGIKSLKIEFDPESKDKKNPGKKFKKILNQESLSNTPNVIELVLPSHPEAWEGIWAVKGNEVSRKIRKNH